MTSQLADPRLNYLSYSSLLTLHECPRKFELQKLGSQVAQSEDSLTSLTFAYGHLVGSGIQALLCGSTLDQVLWHSFCNWPVDLLIENERQNKSFWEACYAIMQFSGMINSGFLADYEVLTLDNKPAAELSFRIRLPNNYAYRGYVDLVLVHRYSGEVLVLEIKTTSAKYIKEEQYKNSAQAIGYSIVLDHLFKDLSSYKVLYLPYLTHSRKFEPMEFTKLFSQRARWLQELLLDIHTLELYRQSDLFPMRGESCLSFGRPCTFFGNCTMSNQFLLTPYSVESDPELERSYSVDITFEELVDSQLNLVGDLNG